LPRIIIILLIYFSAFNAHANELELSSFGTLAMTLSDSKQYGFRRDIRSDNGVFEGDVDFKEFSLIGGQLETKLGNNVDFVGQVVLRDIAKSKWDDYISLAFMRYTPNTNWSFRLGRLSPDLFMITEYRNVNIAYSWAKVPTEVYGIIPFLYYDGADVSYSTRVGDALVRAKFFAGESDSIVFADSEYEGLALDKMLGSSLTYDKGDWNLQFRFSQGKLSAKSNAVDLINTQIALLPDFIWPNKQAFYSKVNLKNIDAKYLSLSGQKYLGNWLFSFELAKVDADSKMISTLNSGYVSAAYQYNQHTFYTVIAQTDSKQYKFNEVGVNTALIPELIQAIDYGANFYSSNQQSMSVGWRWDITPSIVSKLQFTRTDISENGDTLWINTGLDSPKEKVNSLVLSLSFAL